VLAATHRDLNASWRKVNFERNLLYRLAVVPIEIPPLRERLGDIPLLVEYFIDRFWKKGWKEVHDHRQEISQTVRGYNWPGNVRELQNVIERAVILCEGENVSRWKKAG